MTSSLPPFNPTELLKNLPDLPGVYRMMGEGEVLLYVGKAKNLKKRVASYFRATVSSPRIALMVSHIVRVDITVTRTEAEALLLENNLIKSLNPRFNILFRDDKSYPYILMSKDSAPRIAFYRGKTDAKADYFGPFPSANSVRESIQLLQRLFLLRTCENAVFHNRSRPCLLFQIKRCSAPCADEITPENYKNDVRMASLFLAGKSSEIMDVAKKAMNQAAEALDFEQAALYRDQIQSLRAVQEKQFVESQKGEDADIICVVKEDNQICVNLAMVRGGRHLGDKPLFPKNAANASVEEALEAFLTQHYAGNNTKIPPRVYVNCALPDKEIETTLSALNNAPIRIIEARINPAKSWVEQASSNAKLALLSRKNCEVRQSARIAALVEVLNLEETDNPRIECFDISHTQGESTVASCVVFHQQNMKKSDYRRFNIKDVKAGDDYAAIRQAVLRRYEKLIGEKIDEEKGEPRSEPDLILIDGGKGQVSAAFSALEELGLTHIPMIGVAKGVARKAGLEVLIFTDNQEPLQLGEQHLALLLIQEIRDEAHRFAISGHRNARSKTRQTSSLNEIKGVGAKRRKALLMAFGGLIEIKEASMDELKKVAGISPELAGTIFNYFH